MVVGQIRNWWQGKPQVDPLGRYPEPSLRHLILFVTDRCNMRCDHCMFWQRIDDPGPEMSLEEIQKLARTTPPLQTLAVTGGEPFLRKDLDRIVESFFRDNHTHHIQINTNGLLLDRMMQLPKLGLAEKYGKFLSYQVSLDGLEETHDDLRALPGSFKKIVGNLRELVKLQPEIPGFRVTVLTNINKRNYDQIETIARLLHEDIGVEHAYDIVRGFTFSTWGVPKTIAQEEGPRDPDLPPLDRLDEIVETIRHIDEREGGTMAPFVRQLEVQAGLYKGVEQPFRCLSAGRLIGVVYSDGSVAACEFTLPFAKLSDYDFDLHALWTGPEGELRRKQIQSCTCAHSCFTLTSMVEWEEQHGRPCVPPIRVSA